MREGYSNSLGVGRSTFRLIAAASVLAVAGLTQPHQATAALAASDNASDSAYSSGWSSLSNGGSGFGAWTLSGPSDTGQGGFFIGDSTGNGTTPSGGINTTGSKAWGMYANSGQTANAYRPLTGALAGNQLLLVSIDNGYVNNPGSDGISLKAGGASGALRFEFYFNGGSTNYTYNDSTGTHDSGIGYTDGGLSLVFQPTSASTYSLKVTPAAGGGTSTFTGGLIGSPTSLDIDTFRAFDFNSQNGSNGNFFVNSLSVIPEPSSLGLVAMAGALLVRRNKRSAKSVIE